jgi:hypothetical protein
MIRRTRTDQTLKTDMKAYKGFLCLAIVATMVLTVNAQKVRTAEEEAAYTKAIVGRADKIVKTLDIADTAKATRVRHIIARQYRDLSTIHDASEQKIKALEQPIPEKEKRKDQVEAIENETNGQLDKLHTEYLARLSAELSVEQVEKVKDGMTYGVLPITYNGYLDMLPDLSAEQKSQIKAFLIEARENAMDAGSSEKKHWWFGKYKGKINNYLSGAGYDMKKAGEEWEKRRKAASGKS